MQIAEVSTCVVLARIEVTVFVSLGINGENTTAIISFPNNEKNSKFQKTFVTKL